MKPLPKTEKEWKTCLTQEQYEVLRKKGTERAFSGKYYNHHDKGKYLCAACKNHLFSSQDKFDSGTGWPSFTKPEKEKVKLASDDSLFMKRKEVLCSACKSHLGHVFDDGPKPGGKRYCINSLSLDFKEEK